MKVRFAEKSELDRVNELRRQVNELHVAGKPDVFKPGFAPELRDFIHTIWDDAEKEIVVAEREGVICGFAVLHHVKKPENPFKYEDDFLDIDEFGVDEAYRRSGVGTVLHSLNYFHFHCDRLELLSCTSYITAAFMLASRRPGLDIKILYYRTLYSTAQKSTQIQSLVEDARM